MRKDDDIVDSIAAYGALIISFLTIAGGAARWILERRRRARSEDIDDIDKLLERIDKLSKRIDELVAERARDYQERQKLRNDLWAANGRIYQLEQAQKAEAHEREGLKRLFTIALEYINVLSKQVVELGGEPRNKPPEIDEWLDSQNHKEK